MGKVGIPVMDKKSYASAKCPFCHTKDSLEAMECDQFGLLCTACGIKLYFDHRTVTTNKWAFGRAGMAHRK